MSKEYTIKSKMFGTVTGTEDQILELCSVVNYTACHYIDLMKREGRGLWEQIYLDYSREHVAIWNALQEAKNEH